MDPCALDPDYDLIEDLLRRPRRGTQIPTTAELDALLRQIELQQQDQNQN